MPATDVSTPRSGCSAARPARLGAIGAGAVFERYRQAASRLPGVSIAAVADVDGARLARCAAAGVTLCGDPRALVELPLDGVLVLSPHALHERHVRLALEAGHAVLCEKPLATTPAAAEGLLRDARRTGRRLTVAMHCRYRPEVAWLLEHLREPVARFEHRYLEDWRRGAPWYLDPRQGGGGVLLDVGVNQVDWLSAVLGAMRPVEAWCACAGEAVEVEARVRWTFPGGSGTTHFGWRAEREEKWTHVETASGRTYLLDHARHRVTADGVDRGGAPCREYDGVLRDFVRGRPHPRFAPDAPVTVLWRLREAYAYAGLPFLGDEPGLPPVGER